MTPCKEFQGHRDAKGYCRYGGRKAHRVEWEKVQEIKERLKHYKRGMVAALAREYNVRPERISHIKTGRTWT